MQIIYFLASTILAFLIIIAFFITKHRKKLAKELQKKIQNFLKQINIFFTEYSDLTKHYISETEENEFALKWQNLYSEISKYHITEKTSGFLEIKQFKETYKNLHQNISVSNAEISRKEKVKNIAQKTDKFFIELFYKITTHYVPHSQKVSFIQKWNSVFVETENCDVRSTDSELPQIEQFKSVFTSFDDYIETANENFIRLESEKYDKLFSNIDGKSLDEEQRRAVITDEDRILVLAGAGSGKTLTISAKVKYLCEAKHINPSEILLISFTRKSAEEMTERIQNKLGLASEATTFHKLGLDIIKNADGKRPELFDDNALNKFVHNFFESEVVNHPELVKNLTEYFAYFLEIPENLEDYSSLGELYEEEKTSDLETLKSKYEREKFIQKEKDEKSKLFTTLKNEKVKSLEETKIANFLFMNGVNYEYEKPYPFENEDTMRKTYQPDFYLTDYDIYLEHFGVSKDFTVPWLSTVEEKKYLDGIKWKREVHQKNGTKLIETYSYYNSEGILLKKLEEILRENGVELKPRDFTDIFNTVYKSKSNKYFSEFIKLCCTFITLFKSDNYKTDFIFFCFQSTHKCKTNISTHPPLSAKF